MRSRGSGAARRDRKTATMQRVGLVASAFMRERIFEPLGMQDTGFTVREVQLDRVATCCQTAFSTGGISVLDAARNDLLRSRAARIRRGRPVGQ